MGSLLCSLQQRASDSMVCAIALSARSVVEDQAELAGTLGAVIKPMGVALTTMGVAPKNRRQSFMGGGW